ncbi:MAG: HAD family phosphatase [Rhodoblastus sp.]
MTKKDVVFDLGNVLLRWDPRHLYRKVFSDGARMERFLSSACSHEWIHSIDGCHDFSEPVAARAKAFPEFAKELALFDTRWLEMLDGAMEENLAIMRALKAQGRPVYGLTNYPAQKFEATRAIHPFLDEFDAIVVSGREGVTKPDPRIYEILFDRAGRAPRELVFVDDIARNIAAAETLGMAGVLYEPGIDLATELSRAGAL